MNKYPNGSTIHTQVALRLEGNTRVKLSAVFEKHLQDYPDACVYLFGSRANPGERGGDLDLLVVSQHAQSDAYQIKKKLRMAIREQLGDQRVDVIVSADPNNNVLSPFIHLAYMDGVKIWP